MSLYWALSLRSTTLKFKVNAPGSVQQKKCVSTNQAQIWNQGSAHLGDHALKCPQNGPVLLQPNVYACLQMLPSLSIIHCDLRVGRLFDVRNQCFRCFSPAHPAHPRVWKWQITTLWQLISGRHLVWQVGLWAQPASPREREIVRGFLFWFCFRFRFLFSFASRHSNHLIESFRVTRTMDLWPPQLPTGGVSLVCKLQSQNLIRS